MRARISTMASGQLASYALKNVYGLCTGEKKGSGAYGVVYKVTVDGVPCIAKRLHDILVDPGVPKRQRASIQQKSHGECVLLSQLRHPNVVHFVVSFPDPFRKNREGVWQHVLHRRVRAHCTVRTNQVAELATSCSPRMCDYGVC